MECGTLIAWEQLVLEATRLYETGCSALRTLGVANPSGPAITCDNHGIGWLEALHRCYDDTQQRFRTVRTQEYAEPIMTCDSGNSLVDLFLRTIVETPDGWAVNTVRHPDAGTITGDCSDCGHRGVHEALYSIFAEDDNRGVAVVVSDITDLGLIETDKGCAGHDVLQRILGSTRVTNGVGHAFFQEL